MKIIEHGEYFARTGQSVKIGDCLVDLGNNEFAYAFHKEVVVEVPINEYNDHTFVQASICGCIAIEEGDWYLYDVDAKDMYGNKRKNTSIVYDKRELSKKEMKEKGYSKKLGKIHFSEDTYYGLDGKTTNSKDYQATISAMEKDFDKMNYTIAKNLLFKAEEYLSKITWNEELPTIVDLGVNRFVVPSQKYDYKNVNNWDLYNQFSSYLKKHNKSIRYHPINNQLGGNSLMFLEVLIVPGIPIPKQETKKRGDRNKDEQKIMYYKKAGIIR